MGTCSSSKQNPLSHSTSLSTRKSLSLLQSNSYSRTTSNPDKPALDISKDNVADIYTVSKTALGEGHFASVFLARRHNDKDAKFALKVIKRRQSTLTLPQIRRELNIMRDADHPNIVQFCETYSTPNRFFIVMEHLEGGTLKECVMNRGGLGEEEVKDLVFQICMALNHLHEKGVAHRDFKLENLIFKDKERKKVKLVDFGLAREFRKQKMLSYIGTPFYAPPEIVQQNAYDEKCDNWSLGVCVYKMLTGIYPFKSEEQDVNELFYKIRNDTINQKPLSSFSKECRNFVNCLLTKNPKKRKNIKDLIFHPWFNSHHEKLISRYSTNIDKRIFFNIKGINGINRFGLQLLKIMIIFFEKPKDYKLSEEAFFCADYCLNGFISSDNLKRFFKENSKKIDEEELREVMETLNIYEKDFITFTEFVIATIDRYDWIVNGNLIDRLFKFLDVDNSKKVTVANLKELFTRFGYLIDDDYINELISFFGGNVKEEGFDLDTFSRFIFSNFFSEEKEYITQV